MLIIFLSSSPSSFESSLNRKCHVGTVLLNLMLVLISTAPHQGLIIFTLPLLNAKPREDKQDEAFKRNLVRNEEQSKGNKERCDENDVNVQEPR